ncbi:hypothetical protein HY417_00855 [Candidatus Kaiserbacteria bacterium]|nr:hypothetical protein [Candidatus Kaiserbacteria bacterium]
MGAEEGTPKFPDADAKARWSRPELFRGGNRVGIIPDETNDPRDRLLHKIREIKVNEKGEEVGVVWIPTAEEPETTIREVPLDRIVSWQD